MQLFALGSATTRSRNRLVVSPATVKTHVGRAMMKLDVHDRAQLVVLAYETGILLPRMNHRTGAGRRLALA